MKAIWVFGIVALAVCSTANAAGRLDIKLQNVKTAKVATAGASVTVTMSNTGDQSIEIPASYVPELGKDGVLQANIFNITQEDGSAVDYRGIYVHNVRGSTGKVVLAPGQLTVKTIDLSLSYEIMPGRKYSVAIQPFVRYREQPEPKSKTNSADMKSLRGATSNTIEITPQANNSQSFSNALDVQAAQVCDNSQRSAVQEAILNAGDLALQAVIYTQSLLQYDANAIFFFNQTPRYTKWYGTYGDPNDMSSPNGMINGEIAWRLHVNAIRLGRIQGQLPNAPMVSATCSCDKQGKVDPATTIAWVNATEPYVINVCPIFFTLPAIGNAQNSDSKAGTILHETSHFNDGYTAGTSDLGDPNNPVEDAKFMAGAARDLAADNAYNIEYYSSNLEGDQ
ncbi:hypothetical protein JWH11_07830 [Xanthomonas melonis]|uniref:Lysine-specific metallo-endopeptidase domain-containing protein n=1 Tax=Xanthomonas melonis TaxID=56456 RepID=A0ABS8NTF0_9XANT|nr:MULTISPECIES: M35 family metallo-endopeptidase [Xanthomonas]MCC4588940.1 hypothetical protein [Xanthomonas sp. NCPPB 1067]MCD0258136.1 hypothetical protein [Xanthomonas melonis]MCD0266356.1 hypothetical protein [Xanthomonas melonis]